MGSRSLAWGGLAIATLFAGHAACSASVDAGSSGAATTGSGGSGGGGTVASTSASSGGIGGGGAGGSEPSACTPFDGAVLAIDELYVGGITFDGMTSSNAWKDFGFDLDGQATASDVATHCKPAAEGSTSAFVDGPEGRDNSFGRNVLPAVNALVPPLDGQANDAIDAGQFTQIFAFEGLGAEADVASLVTKVYGGGALGVVPAWKGADCWPVLQESLTDPTQIGSAKAVFATSTLEKNVWSSNGEQDIVLTLNVAGQVIPIKVYKARMRVQLAPTHQGGALGQIGGFLKTEEFVQTIRAVAGAISPAACSLFDSTLADQLRRASDMLDDGTQDPTKTCNAISVGMGFTLRQVAFGAIAPKAPEPIDYCAGK